MLSIGGFDERRRIDWDWDCWIKLVLAGASVGLVVEPLYRWRLRQESLSARVVDNLREDIVMFEALLHEHPGLTQDDRATIDAVMKRLQRRISFLDARASLIEHRGDARRRQLDVVFGRGYGLQTRAKAGAAFVAPRWAGRSLARQVEASGTGGWNLADR
jgi:hypothetical protein